MIEALRTYHVAEYQAELAEKVNNICLEMGYSCSDDKYRFQSLSIILSGNIDSISSDPEVRKRLDSYANRVIKLANYYWRLSK